MQWLLEPLEHVFQWTFEILKWGKFLPSFGIIALVMFGLALWTFYFQPKYNKLAEKDPNQLK